MLNLIYILVIHIPLWIYYRNMFIVLSQLLYSLFPSLLYSNPDFVIMIFAQDPMQWICTHGHYCGVQLAISQSGGKWNFDFFSSSLTLATRTGIDGKRRSIVWMCCWTAKMAMYKRGRCGGSWDTRLKRNSFPYNLLCIKKNRSFQALNPGQWGRLTTEILQFDNN